MRRTALIMMAAATALAGCSSATDNLPDDARTREADAQVRSHWGKGLDALPQETLVLISPNNRNIQQEFEWAFSLDQAVRRGRRVRMEWRDVGGGGSTIRTYLTNVYSRSDSSGIDVLWGGGDAGFIPLAQAGVLAPLDLSSDVREQIPAELSGTAMYDKDRRWAGSALSAFGFIYNAGMLRRCGIEAPATWQDLSAKPLAGLVSLADPTQSSSAAAAYQMIVWSGRDWPDGWARLLAIMANADRFTDSAGTAASAPLVGTALVATCIDFYGALRVAEAPGELIYVSPRGGTTFSPDPIAILKNPPHPELAKEFVDFVLSSRGQALWALPVGVPQGPSRNLLGRMPIRKDVYRLYEGRLMGGITDPFQAGQSMTLAPFARKVDFGVLRQLVKAAAVDSLPALKAARAALAAATPDQAAALAADFNRLPENIATIEGVTAVAKAIKDDTQRERIVTDWQRFFAEKYARIARASSMGVPPMSGTGVSPVHSPTAPQEHGRDAHATFTAGGRP